MLLRIDLSARRYCIADCKELWSISSASAGRIDFRDHEVGNEGSAVQAKSTSWFDRNSNIYHGTKVMNYTLSRGSPRRTMTIDENLACVVGPFSGFTGS